MSETKALEAMIGEEYKYGFSTDIEYDDFPVGINEDVVRLIYEKKNEPEWMTEVRLNAYRAWTEMEEPDWFNAMYEKENFETHQDYSAAKHRPKVWSRNGVEDEA